MCACVRQCVGTCIHIYVCICVCVNEYRYVFICAYIYIYICMCLCVYEYVYVLVRMYVYTHVFDKMESQVLSAYSLIVLRLNLSCVYPLDEMSDQSNEMFNERKFKLDEYIIITIASARIYVSMWMTVKDDLCMGEYICLRIYALTYIYI